MGLLLLPLLLSTLAMLSSLGCSARHLTALVEQQPLTLTYHKGQLLSGPISVNLIWYGKFTPSQRAVVSDFVTSLSAGGSSTPSVAAWWATVEKYHLQAKAPKPVLTLGKQTLDENYSLGRRIGESQLALLATRAGSPGGSVNVVLTAEDVAVDGFCMSRCGTHASSPSSLGKGRQAYIWVGNSAAQCPGHCAWPFHQPIYGPQTPPLGAPNGDVGVDGMVINLASLLVGTVTNPFGNGYFQGERGAGLEAASACTGVFGKGAYPGYPGEVIVDRGTGGSYNANGVNGRKYLLPAMVDPGTKACATLV